MSNYRYTNTILALVSSLIPLSATFAEETTPTLTLEKEQPKEQAIELAKVSEAFGHLIGKNIESLGFAFDINQVVKGLQDAAAGKQSPMSEAECVQAITAVQEAVFKQMSAENLKKAEAFLSKNAGEKNVVSVEDGKLQYKVEKSGKGAEVQPHFSPLIRYTGKYLDGTVFGTSKEDELISLDETIPGFSKGLLGMKEGEKRTLYIHPELGYGTNGLLPPNSLLTFEIEIVKANAATLPQNESITSISPAKKAGEVATPSHTPEAIR